MPKDRITRDIDRPAPIQIGSADLGVAPSYAPPALGSLDAPDGLNLATGLLRSASTPLAYISATWNRPDGSDPTEYVVQASTSSSFTTATTITYRAAQASATLDGLTHNTLYYVRVAAVYYARQSAWSDSASITTANDTTAPGVVSSLAGTFSAAGDLLLTWTLPTSANLKDCEVRIYASNGGTLLRTVYVTGSSYLYPAATNRADSGGTPDPTLYVLVRTRNWANAVSSDVSVSPSSTAPAAPAGVNVDFTAPDLLLQWTRQADAIAYRLTLDGIGRIVTDPFYRYPFALNTSEHSGGSGSAPGYVSTNGATFANPATSGAVALPGSLQDNDYVLALVVVRAFSSAVSTTTAGALTPPAGWTLIREQPRDAGTSQPWFVAFGRFVNASDSGASLTWNWAALISNYNIDIRYLVYRGVHLTTPVNGSNGASWTSGSTTSTTGAVTTTVGQTTVIQAATWLFASTGRTTTPPGGFTERYDVNPSGATNTMLHSAADATQASAGSTGTPSLTASASATGMALTLALAPASTSNAPDPVISYSLTALNGLDQESTATTGTATNAAPATVSISVTAYFNTLAISLGQSAAADLSRYRVRVYRDAALIDTFYTTSLLTTYAATVSGSYTADVTVEDVFGQLSTVTTSSAAALDGLTIADLRSSIRYRDSLGSDPATLKAALADNNVSTATPTYPVSTWSWTEAIRDVADRYQTITLGVALGISVYIATSLDGTSWAWFSGPLTSSRILTSVANQAAAESAAFVPTTGSLIRLDLPTIQEARFIRVYHRYTSSTYTLREFYPRRLVQSDDIEAEAIKAINIAAASITADRLSVSQLSAITANLGTITAGTITGATIRTAASGERVELTSTGLRTYDSSGNVQVEATTSTNGELTAGGGNLRFDRNGQRLRVGNLAANSIRWVSTDDADTYVTFNTDLLVGAPNTSLAVAHPTGAQPANLYLSVDGGSNSQVEISSAASVLNTVLTVAAGGSNGDVDILGSGSGAPTLNVRGSGAWMNVSGYGVISGNATIGATTAGSARLTTVIPVAKATTATTTIVHLLTNDVSSPLNCYVQLQTHATAGSRYAAIGVTESGVADRELRLQPSGGPLRLSANSLGFFGTAPGARPTITGSRGSNAALASLLTALATLGLVTDSTT